MVRVRGRVRAYLEQERQQSGEHALFSVRVRVLTT